MSLSSAMDTAKSSLIAAQTRTSVVSRNIANVNTVGATKKIANVITGSYGRVEVSSITQSSNTVLYRNVLDATAALGKSNVIANGLDRINDTLGDTTLARSPAALVTALGDALQTLSASPNNYELARKAATAAENLVTSLNEATTTVQTIRNDADDELVNAAADMNAILAKIKELNDDIVGGTQTGVDITDLSDERDRQVVALSAYVGVTSQLRGDNDLVLYTDSGVTLFETNARAVEYSATAGLNQTVAAGNSFRIDGMSMTGENSYMPVKSGIVAGLISLRDDVLVTYQTQLDEIARGLVASFSESDPDGLEADATGLFASTTTPTDLELSQTYSAGSIAIGDRLTFEITYGNDIYEASYVVPSTATIPLSTADYVTALQTAIDESVSTSGNGALGSNRVVVTASGTALTITAEGAGSYSPFALSSVSASPNDATRTGGIALPVASSTAGTSTTAASVEIGDYSAGSIAAGDTLAFDFDYNGTSYRASHTFTAAPTSAAAFETILQNAVNAATNTGTGVALGTGNVVADVASTTPFAITLSTSAVGTSQSIDLSSVTGIASGTSAAGKTGGLTAASALPSVTGLAGALTLGTGVSSDPTLIRDGVTFDFNTLDVGGYTSRLNALSTALSTSRAFSATSDADTAASLADYAGSSVSWLQAYRQEAISETEYKTTLLEQTQKTLSDETGINMDEQLTQMIEIERSYQASSKLISTIDEMMQTLLDSI